jgi:acyl-CoA hydrolase
MSEINFTSSAKQGDIIEIGIEVVKFGTSLTLKCEVRNMMTRETIISIASTTMVNLGKTVNRKHTVKRKLNL